MRACGKKCRRHQDVQRAEFQQIITNKNSPRLAMIAGRGIFAFIVFAGLSFGRYDEKTERFFPNYATFLQKVIDILSKCGIILQDRYATLRDFCIKREKLLFCPRRNSCAVMRRGHINLIIM